MSLDLYSEIELLTKMKNGELAHAPMATTIPMKIIQVEHS